LAGRLVFGMLMGMMGMLPMVGMLIRVQNALAGFIVHMVISAFIGAVYGLVTAFVFIPLAKRNQSPIFSIRLARQDPNTPASPIF
jgi:hypothetical protein